MNDIHRLAETLSDADLATILRLRIERYQNMYQELTGGGRKVAGKKSAPTIPQKRRGRKPKNQDESGSAQKPAKAKRPGRPAGSRKKKKASSDSDA